MDGGAWWAAVHGVAKSQTRLSDFTFTFHFHALEKEMATHSSVLAWRIPGMGEPGGLLSMGSHRVGHDWSDLAAYEACTNHWTNFQGQKPKGKTNSTLKQWSSRVNWMPKHSHYHCEPFGIYPSTLFPMHHITSNKKLIWLLLFRPIHSYSSGLHFKSRMWLILIYVTSLI